MKIINKANGQETTVSRAVSIATDSHGDSELCDMFTRLLEELTNSGTLRHRSLERVLGYGFEVKE